MPVLRLSLLSLLLPLLACGRAPAPSSSGIQRDIERAADEQNVPRPLLLALAWTQSRWSMNPGHKSIDGGWGLFHLVDGPDAAEAHSLLRAARLTGLDPQRLRTDPFANALGGAALLRAQADLVFPQYRDLREDRLGDWFEVVMLDSGLTDARLATSFAESVFHALRDGVAANDGNGAPARLEPQAFELAGQSPWVSQSQELSGEYCPNGACVRYVQAANYSSGRSGLGLQYVVIHDMEGYYEASIQYFTNPGTQASAHYDVRSSDGQITQQVRDGDTAWHAGNWDVNQRSVGIEHEGFAHSGGQWYTEAMYKSSAALTRWLCDRFNIPKDRHHIIGHYEVPNPDHAGWFGGAGAHHDPCDSWAGSPTWHNVSACYWNWDHYMALVTGGSGGGGGGPPPPPPPPPPTQGTLSGFVGDACCGTGSGRKALPGATVTLAGTSHAATTDAAGFYSFKLNAGDYTPHAAAAGYQNGDHTSVGGTATVVVHSGKTTWGSVLLHPAAAAKPVVHISSPAAGATVSTTPLRVTGTCSGAATVHIGKAAFAVQGGNFTGSVGLVAGPNTIAVSATGPGGSTSASVHVTYGPPQTGVQGAVTSAANGAAVAGALVSLSSGGHAQTDAQGRFSVGAPAGDHTLSVQASGFAAWSAAVSVAKGLATRNVVLAPVPAAEPPQLRIDEPTEGETFTQTPATISGAVSDPSVSTVEVNGTAFPVVDGAFSGPVPLHEGPNTIAIVASNGGGAGNAEVHVTYAPVHTGVQGIVTDGDTGAAIAGASVSAGNASAKSGGDGQFQLELPAGETTLVISAAGYHEDKELVSIPDQGFADFDVSLEPGTNPVAGAPRISIWSPSDGDVVTAAAVAVTGAVDDPSVSSVSINGVPVPVADGEFHGSAELKQGPNTIAVAATNAQGTTTERLAVTFAPATSGVQGTVASSTGKPIAFALVVLQEVPGSSAQTGADGSFRIVAPPGSYTLAASAGGYAATTATVDIPDGDFAVADLSLTAVATSGAPQVIIADPADAQVVTSGRIAVRGTIDDPAIGVAQIAGRAFPVLNGIFDGVAELSPGANAITVSVTSAGGTGSATVNVTYDATQTGVHGQISSAADGLGIAAAVIELTKGAHAQTDFAGNYRLGAPAGDYTLSVNAAGYQPFSRPVTIAAGESAEVVVLLVALPQAGGHLHITSPSSGDHVPAGTVAVAGTADIPGLRSLAVNGAAVAPDAAGNFSAQVPVQAGDNQIYVRATDADGKVYADAIYVRVEAGPSAASPGTGGCQSAASDPALLCFAALAALWRSRSKARQR